MILRFKHYSVAGAGATALLAARRGDAFAPTAFQRPAARSTATTRLRASPFPSLDRDWDNEDFLSSLGGGEARMAEANDAYWREAEARAAIKDWRFKKSGEGRAGPPPQPQATQPPPPPPPQPQLPPPPSQPQPQQFFDADGNPIAMPMVYDASGNLVPLSSLPQVPPPQMPPPVVPVVEPPLPPKTKGTEEGPRPVGYNADAYTMANTADVYFSQLKQDSRVRKAARMAGDVDAANKVFEDDSIRRIKESWNENPYTKE